MPIPTLPVELFVEILGHLPVCDDDSSIKTLSNAFLANSQTRTAASTSLLWKPHYQHRYVHCVEARERERRKALGGDWRLLYIQRRLLDRHALYILGQLRDDRTGRHERVRRLAELSFDIWDVLRQEEQLPLPYCLLGGAALTVPQDAYDNRLAEENVLPRKFWAGTALGIIARRHNIQLWNEVFQINGNSISFEDALASLSSAFDFSIQEITMKLEGIYEQCREMLVQSNVCLDPRNPAYDIWDLCIKIRSVLREMGFCLATGLHFNRPLTQFPHNFLQEGHRQTIPMSLVYVFVAMARRLGIRAFPMNFPGAVQAYIESSDPTGEDIILDVCSEHPPIRASNIDDLRALSPYHFTTMPSADADATRPAGPAAMLLRAFNNILIFIRFERMHLESSGTPPETQENAIYIVELCRSLHTPDIQMLPVPPEGKPLDASAVLLDGLCPHLEQGIRATFESYCHKRIEMDDKTESRTREPNVQQAEWFVGMVFRHVEYKYTGYITGWDSNCEASEEWIARMGVDRLGFGRHQPFYTAVADDGQTRYVAQENIQPIMPICSGKVMELFDISRSSFSRYFTGIADDDTEKPGRLSLSKELQDLYPDDDDYGRRSVRITMS
ncbi:hypothetical protein K474DRAFT_1658979 [Panus rudis PR-1116 ss-1]|nr:hypothetical protein K474DRAFT_1658979 [Panus rudis PR-1116 ss-1]